MIADAAPTLKSLPSTSPFDSSSCINPTFEFFMDRLSHSPSPATRKAFWLKVWVTSICEDSRIRFLILRGFYRLSRSYYRALDLINKIPLKLPGWCRSHASRKWADPSRTSLAEEPSFKIIINVLFQHPPKMCGKTICKLGVRKAGFFASWLWKIRGALTSSRRCGLKTRKT